ncbi:MAG: AI-2E family transporter [Patescibacteria group bacterium]
MNIISLNKKTKNESDFPERAYQFFSNVNGGQIALGIFFGVLSIFIAYQIRSVLSLFLIGFVISLVARPFIDWMEKFKIPRGISALFAIIFIILFLVASALVITIVIVNQIPEIVNAYKDNFPQVESWIKENFPSIYKQDIMDSISANFDSIGKAAQVTGTMLFGLVSGVINGFYNFLMVLFVSYYFMVDKSSTRKIIDFFLPEKDEKMIDKIESQLYSRMAQWGYGQVILMVLVGVLSYFAYLIAGLKLAGSLAIIAGLLEIIPVLGPVIATIPAVFVGATQNIWAVIGAIIASQIVQQIENNIFVPKIMGSSVGFSPLITLFIILVGAVLGGIIGMFLSIPASIFISEILKCRTENKNVT